jgi:hypothetical protein
LGPARPGARGRIDPEDVQFLGPKGTTQSSVRKEVIVDSPSAESYVWNGWEMPITKERIKQSALRLREVFEGMEARETQAGRNSKRE